MIPVYRHWLIIDFPVLANVEVYQSGQQDEM